MKDEPQPNPTQDAIAEDAADLILEANDSLEERRAEQHDLLDAVAEEEGAPLLETQCTIHGVTVPVSGRLTGEFVERVENLDAEAKRRASGETSEGSVSDIVKELAVIIDDLIDDRELTANGVYGMYQKDGAGPVRTILEEVIDSLKREQDRLEGTADGFRQE